MSIGAWHFFAFDCLSLQFLKFAPSVSSPGFSARCLHGLTAILLLVCSFCLSGCSSDPLWRDSYNLRQWEYVYLAGQAALRAHKYPEAEDNLRSAVNYAELLHGDKDCSKLVTSMSELARACFLNGQTAEAEKWYQRTMSTLNDSLKKSVSPDQRELLLEEDAEILGRLGQLHYSQHQLDVARKELGGSLQMYRSLGIMNGSPQSRLIAKLDYAGELASAAAAAYDAGNYAEAEKLCVEFRLPSLITVCTPNIADAVQHVYVNALRKQGKNDEAEQLTLTDAWAKESDDARFSEIQKDQDKALGQYLKALSIAEQIKNNSQMLEATHTALANIYLSQHDLTRARKSAMIAARLGGSTPELDRALYLLTRFDLFSPMALVEPEAQTLLQLRQKLYGDRDPKVAGAYLSLAAICDYHHEPAKFESYCENAFAILNRAGQPKNDTREYDANCLWLADFLFCQGKYSQAKLLYEQLLHQAEPPRAGVFANRLFRSAAVNSALSLTQESLNNESFAKRVLTKNPASTYAVLRSLTPLARDLQEHKREVDARKVCTYLSEVMATAQPQTENDQSYRKICQATIDAIYSSRIPPIKRLLGRIAPGSYEDTNK